MKITPYKIKKNLIYALIPIKEKSERIKSKNFVKIKNKYLFEHTITTLKKCNFIEKIYLSTDSYLASKITK